MRRRSPPDPATVATGGGTSLDADAVVLAPEAHQVARLLRYVDPGLAHLLEGIPYASSGTVTLAHRRADVAHPLFYGYTFSSGGTWAGYIPDLRSAAYGGYGADASTRIEVGAGEKIILRHLTLLYELLGMWLGKPGRS